jgi:hypothetical protein
MSYYATVLQVLRSEACYVVCSLLVQTKTRGGYYLNYTEKWCSPTLGDV